MYTFLIQRLSDADGWGVYASEDRLIPRGWNVSETGTAAEISNSWHGRVSTRQDIAAVHGIAVEVHPYHVDEFRVFIYNQSELDYTITKGQCIATLSIVIT